MGNQQAAGIKQYGLFVGLNAHIETMISPGAATPKRYHLHLPAHAQVPINGIGLECATTERHDHKEFTDLNRQNVMRSK